MAVPANNWLIKTMLKERVITAIGLLIVFIAVFFAASASIFQLCVAIVAAAAAYEWANLSSRSERHCQVFAAVTGLLALLMMSALYHNNLVLLTAWAVTVFWVYVLFKLKTHPVKQANALNDWSEVVVGAALPVVTVLCLYALRFELPNASAWLLLYCLSLVWVMDTGAYFVGKRFGKVKLAPLISPGKTREGVIGGVAAACSLFLLAYLFGSWADKEWLAIFIATVVAAPFSVVGDLYESRLKRSVDAKDSSNLLPGHGGVLDRIDGVLATVPVFTAIYLLLAPGA